MLFHCNVDVRYWQNHIAMNNLEVVLLDIAMEGIWTVKVSDAQHSGSKTQPYALAVLGHGVNDLRPDPTVVPEAFQMDVAIPQVGDEVLITTQFFNFGNVKADLFPIAFEVDGTEIDRTSIELGAGVTKTVMWNWIPQTAGTSTLSFIMLIIASVKSNILSMEQNTGTKTLVTTDLPNSTRYGSTTSWDVAVSYSLSKPLKDAISRAVCPL